MALYDWLNSTAAAGINQATQGLIQTRAQDRMNALAEQQMKIADFNYKKAQEQEARDNQEIDFDSLAASKGLVSPEEKQVLADFIQGNGFGRQGTDGRLIITRRDTRELGGLAKNDLQFGQDLTQARYMRLAGHSQQIKSQMDKMAEQDPVGFAEDEKYKELSTQYGQVNSQLTNLDKTMQRIKAMNSKMSSPKVVNEGGALVNDAGQVVYQNNSTSKQDRQDERLERRISAQEERQQRADLEREIRDTERQLETTKRARNAKIEELDRQWNTNKAKIRKDIPGDDKESQDKRYYAEQDLNNDYSNNLKTIYATYDEDIKSLQSNLKDSKSRRGSFGNQSSGGGGGRVPVRYGTAKDGTRVVQYSDGSVGPAK